MSALARLQTEVQRSRDAGVEPAFWWRDDDLVGNSGNFDLLMRLSERFRAPLLMAVIPARAQPTLDVSATDPQLAYFCQHGWQHVNYEPAGEPKSEFGAARDSAEVVQELTAGAEVMERLLGARRLPVMVAPWNAFHPAHLDALAAVGFTGLSTYGRRTQKFAATGIRQANAHLDVMLWHLPGGARPMRLDDLLDQLAKLVAARRIGAGADLEPIGLLTHHRPMRPETWPTVEALFSVVAGLPGMSWMSPPEVFA